LSFLGILILIVFLVFVDILSHLPQQLDEEIDVQYIGNIGDSDLLRGE